MTHPTTEPTQSIRDRLARRLAVRDPAVQPWLDMSNVARNRFRHDVDTILSELMEPSEGMIDAARKWAVSDDGPGFWQAMIQYIRDGGK